MRKKNPSDLITNAIYLLWGRMYQSKKLVSHREDSFIMWSWLIHLFGVLLDM